MYVIHLAASLQHMRLPTADSAHDANSLQQTDATLAPSQAGSLNPDSRMMTQHAARLLQVVPNPASSQDPMAASSARLVTPEPSPAAAAADVELLEKAYQLFQETCLSSDTQSCWDAVVQPALHAALTFHAPNTTALLGDAAISPEMFHRYALAYIHSLGVSSNLDKLQEIQNRAKNQMRRRKASTEACQSLFTAATAAEQAALDRKLDQLESQVQEALQSTSMPVMDAAAGEPAAQALLQPVIPDEVSDIQPAGHPQRDAQAQPALQDSETAQASDQAAAMQLPGQPQCMQTSEPVPAPAASGDVPHKELLLSLLAILKRCHSLWKATGAKADAVHESAKKAELQMSRSAYISSFHSMTTGNCRSAAVCCSSGGWECGLGNSTSMEMHLLSQTGAMLQLTCLPVCAEHIWHTFTWAGLTSQLKHFWEQQQHMQSSAYYSRQGQE